MNMAIKLSQVSKSFDTGAGRFNALLSIDLEFEVGEYVAVLGPSGSGKSTMLNLIAGIDRPSSGQVSVSGQEVSLMKESRLAAFRGREIGIVFQFFQLMPTLTVLENVLLAMDLVRTIPTAKRPAYSDCR